uniref:Myopalladin n=1 Tax=Oncorhynchus tshawytscha TaxID=74940 RepID=A0AAZ3SW69_ONCTS
MQENSVDQPTSLSQLLRENYLAEARAHQRHSEMSRSDSSSRRLVYGPLKGKMADSAGLDEPQHQLPDLSAFLSQEELDKSVNLACQAIGPEAREERSDVKASPSATSDTPDTQPDPELKEPLPTHPTFLPERRPYPPLSLQDNVIRTDEQIYQPSQPSIQDNSMRTDRQSFPPSIIQDIAVKDNREDIKRPGAGGRNTPAFGLENQSKKEFLNKAADFIEELSSLFKANSSKRIRPRSCKAHRSRANKGQADGSIYSLNADDRERPILLQDFEMEMERPANPFCNQPPEAQGLDMDPGYGHADFPMQDCRTTEEQYDDTEVLEEDEVDEAESPALVEITPGVYTADPICEPPHFIQKLKSREVSEGSKVQLDCIVQGLPMPEVRWFCEGKELENCPDIQIINNSELHSLIIAEAFEEDTGRYSCFASNFYGTDSTSAEIYIEGASSTDSEGEQHFEHVYILKVMYLRNCTFCLCDDELDGCPLYLARQSLQDLLASESQLVVLECRVKGVPSPKVDWYREGTIIEDSPDFRILQKKEICTLVIAEVFPEDSGTFTCTASNKYGTVSSIAALRVKGNVTGLQTRLRLDSSMSKIVFGDYNWEGISRGGILQLGILQPGFWKTLGTLDLLPYTSIHHITVLHIVKYIFANTFVLIHRPPQGMQKKLPTSTRPMSDVDIRSSQQTLLQDMEKKLRFNEDFMRGHVQQEYKVSNFEQRLLSEIEFRLERTPVEESDDEVQHDESPTGKCVAPIFDRKLRNFRAMEGVPMTFSCKVVGIPVPKVYWFKDGKQILRKNDHYKKIREGDGTCVLHIEVTNNDDDGNYTVMAANPQGRISCSGHLIIQTGPLRNRMTPMIHSQRVRARIQEVEEGEPTQERFFRPHFLQAPGDMVAHEGRVCRLDCKVSGLPNPELMWLINGRPIYPDVYHRMLVRENCVHSLVIDPLKQDDAGTYTCIASNKAGQSSFGLELRVVEKEMKQAPQFVEKLQNTGIAEGTPVRLECRVLGMPPPVIYWKKDNDTIPHTKARVSIHQDATGYVCLLIQPTRKEDAGWYTVSAKNEAGIVSCTARKYSRHLTFPTFCCVTAGV